MYIYGGFDNTNPNLPLDILKKIDLTVYFGNSQISAVIEEGLNGSSDRKGNKEKDINSTFNQISTNQNILLKNSPNVMMIDNNSKKDQKFKLSHQAVVGRVAGKHASDGGRVCAPVRVVQ